MYVNGFTRPGGSANFGVGELRGNTWQQGQRLRDPVAESTTAGTPLDLTARWTGLDPAKRWFGVISYSGAADQTYFSVG